MNRNKAYWSVMGIEEGEGKSFEKETVERDIEILKKMVSKYDMLKIDGLDGINFIATILRKLKNGGGK